MRVPAAGIFLALLLRFETLSEASRQTHFQIPAGRSGIWFAASWYRLNRPTHNDTHSFRVLVKSEKSDGRQGDLLWMMQDPGFLFP